MAIAIQYSGGKWMLVRSLRSSAFVGLAKVERIVVLDDGGQADEITRFVIDPYRTQGVRVEFARVAS